MENNKKQNSENFFKMQGFRMMSHSKNGMSKEERNDWFKKSEKKRKSKMKRMEKEFNN